jgi:hypothetical protein
MWENEDIKKEEPDYKVFEMISTLFAIAFAAGLFIKFLFF